MSDTVKVEIARNEGTMPVGAGREETFLWIMYRPAEDSSAQWIELRLDWPDPVMRQRLPELRDSRVIEVAKDFCAGSDTYKLACIRNELLD